MAKALEVSFVVGAVLAGGFKSAFSQASQAMKALSGQTKTLQQASKDISAYQKLQGSLTQTSGKLDQARARVKELGLQMKAVDNPSASLKAQFAQANKEAHTLQQTLAAQRKELGALGKALTAAGVDTKNLTAAEQKLMDQSRKVTEAQNKLAKARENFAKTKANLSFDNIKGDLLASAGTVMALGAPTMAAADYEMANAKLNAVAFSGAGRDKEQDAKDFAALQAQSRQLGRDTQFTAVQAVQSQESLARAGFKANEIIAAMPGLLDMAAAEGMDLATGADIMASAIRGFGLSADNANRVSNIMAQTSAASNSSISGLGESLKYVAPMASALGISIEETNAMLGKMADAGIKGSQGGTALRAALTRLSKEPKAVAQEFARLGITARDAQGNMREMPDLMIALSNKIKNMGSADQVQILSNIFGSEAGSGMLAIMNASVDGSLQALTRLNRESSGELQALSQSTGYSMDILRSGMVNADKVARQIGVSFGDLSIYTAMLADNNIKGAEADKVLTTAFTALAKQPERIQNELKQFGLTAYDSEGYVKNFATILNELNIAMSNMSSADKLKTISNIFGDSATTGISSLMQSMSSSTGNYTQYSNVVTNQAQGTSGEMSSKMIDTLQGQIEIAKSAISDLSITAGNVLLPVVKEVVSTFSTWTANLGAFASEHPKLTQALVGTIAALGTLKVAATGGSILWNALKLPVDGVKLIKASFEAVSVGGGALKSVVENAGAAGGVFKSIGGSLSALMNPTTLWIGAIAGVGVAAYEVYQHWDDIKAFFNDWIIPNVFEPVMNFASSCIDGVKNVWDSLCSWFSGLSRTDIFFPVVGLASGALSLIENIWGPLPEWFSNISLPNIFAGMSEWCVSAIDSVKGLWNDFCNWLSSLNPFASWSAPAPNPAEVESGKKALAAKNGGSLNYGPSYATMKYAKGGIVSKPVIGLVGEAGREAIIPLEKQSIGTALWIQAGQELGLINQDKAQNIDYMSANSLMNNANINNISGMSANNLMRSASVSDISGMSASSLSNSNSNSLANTSMLSRMFSSMFMNNRGFASANNALTTNSNAQNTSMLSRIFSSMFMNNEAVNSESSIESRLASLNQSNVARANYEAEYGSDASAVNSSISSANSVINPVFNITFANTPENQEDFLSMFKRAWEQFQEQELRVSFA